MQSNPWGANTPINPSNPFNPYNVPIGKMTKEQYDYVQLGQAGLIPSPTVSSTTLEDSSSLPQSPTIIGDTASQTSTVSSYLPVDNMLKKYASLSTIVTLQATTNDNFNKILTTGTYDPSVWSNICQTGGIGNDYPTDENGNAYFNHNLYIDDVSMETLCGISDANKGSNATKINFTINEPHGMTFIEDLYDFCQDFLKENNYLQIPYMVKIEFHGITDDGQTEKVPNATKYIPVHIFNVEVKVSNVGAVYSVTAIPFNEVANTEQHGFVRSDMFIGNTLQVGIAEAQVEEDEGGLSTGTTNILKTTPASKDLYTAADKLAKESQNQGRGYVAYTQGLVHEVIDGFIASLNNHQDVLVKKNIIEKPDRYRVQYVSESPNSDDGGIGQYFMLPTENMGISYSTPTVGKDTPMGPAPGSAQHINVENIAKNTLKYVADESGYTQTGVTYTNADLITFRAGYSIIDCLNTIIINSNYIVEQINVYNNEVNSINNAISQSKATKVEDLPQDIRTRLSKLNDTPLKWFRITPFVQNQEYDNSAGKQCYSRNILYVIEPYLVYNSPSISAPNGNPTKDNRVVKKYDYMFTGNNTEILNFDINFTTAFLTLSQFNKETKIQSTGGSSPQNNDAPPQKSSITGKADPLTSGQSIIQTSSNKQSVIAVGQNNIDRSGAADVASSLYVPADQIHLNLTIMGDPDFIQQDGIFYNAANIKDVYVSPETSPNNGIVFSNGEVYAEVNFKIPIDIKLDTGLSSMSKYNSGTEYTRNVFSGLYRVFQVENKISRNQFTQNITLVRFNNTHDYSI